MAKMTDDELATLVEKELSNSVGYSTGRLSEMRRRAEYYYLGEAKGDLAPPEIEGRSSVVSTDVSDTIEWMLPSLLKIFTASDNAVEFAPQKPGDEDQAKQATAYINYVFYKQNPGFQILYTWFKDALLQKNGITKIWWDDKKDETKEEYRGLNNMQLAMLLEDKEVEPVKHSAKPDDAQMPQYQQAMQQYQAIAQQAQMAGQQPPPPPEQPMLHDLIVKRTKDTSHVCVENVPPEEFRISRNAKSIQTASFTAHQVQKTLSDLTAMGYKNVDELQSDSSSNTFNDERLERETWDDEMAPADLNDDAEPTQRRVWITEAYMRIDSDGDGIAEWRKIVTCGGTVLDNEECDGPPFVSITPIPLPHRFFGRSIADLAMPAQRTKTFLKRALHDNMFLQVNGRTFAVEGQVNLDDLLNNRPGGVVRVKTPTAVGPLVQGMADMAGAYQLLEKEETDKENATGYTRYSQGSNADSLNDTATGINIITNKADERTELIARVFAETGVKDLFLHILKLVCQYQETDTGMQVNGSWLQVNPREWTTQFDFNVNVGLGTGNKDQQVQHLMMQFQQQMAVLPLGVATPQNIYATANKLSENLGFKNPEMFWTDPSKQPPQQPQPNPDMLKVQAQQQKDQADIQHKQAEMQMTAQQQERDAQIKMVQIEEDRKSKEYQAQLQIESAERIAQINGEYALMLQREKNVVDVQEIVTKAHVELAQSNAEIQRTQAEANAPMVDMLKNLHQKIDESNAMETHIVKNPDGSKYAVKRPAKAMEQPQ